MKLPNLLIVADEKTLVAYLILVDGLPEIVKRIEFETDCPTGVPLISWTRDSSGYRTLAKTITELLDRYKPDSWGLACPPNFGNELVRVLGKDKQRSLVELRSLDGGKVDVGNVCQVFGQTAGEFCHAKEEVG